MGCNIDIIIFLITIIRVIYMYNKYNLILFTTIIFLIIIVINYSYNINYKKLEKFNTDSECGDENIFMDNQVQNFCSQICQYPGAGKNPKEKAVAQENCRLNCPSIARNSLIKGMALGNDYLLKGLYKKSYSVKEEEKKIAENVLSSHVIENSRLTHILKEDCTQEQLNIILNDMKKDKYGNWIKIGDSPTQYTYDDKVSILCSSDKNYVNTNIEPHFKNSEINDIIDQHSIIGLLWFEFGNKDDKEIISYISKHDFIEITNSNFIEALSSKIDANKPLKFTKTEINQLFDTNATNISKNYVIINDIVYLPLSPLDSRHLWLFNVKQIAEMREKWYQNLNQEISKLDDITPCTYNNDKIATLPNKISHNGIHWGKIGSSQNEYSLISKYNEAIAAKENAIINCKYTNERLDSLPNKFTEDSIEWGKIGSNPNEYSLISNLKQKENVAKENCLIPGVLHEDISNLPNKLTNPTTNEIYGKYSVIPSEEKYTASYNYPYIDRNNLDNNLSDMCFVSKDNMTNHNGELLWGKKQKYGGEYGLIGGWQDFLFDRYKEKRYGKIKTSTNDGWVGKIGNNTGEYGKIGFSYDNPTGYRWVLFKPKAEQISNNPNIINNQELSTILNGNNEYIIDKNKFDSLNISSITVDSLIRGAKSDTWYKPRDDIYINSNNCDSYNSQLMYAVDYDIISNREQQTLDLTMKYYSDDNTRFVPSVNCPSTCKKDSSNTGECAPCFRKGLITVAKSDWSKLVDSINNNVSGLNTLIGQCENNLIYSENGTNKVKKIANDFKVLKFKVSKTKPVSGNNILTNNKDMNKTLMIEKITKNQDIDAYTWNQLNINVIGPSDYVYVKDNSNYYVIDNETFFEIINDYSNKYEQEYQSKKQTIPNCAVPYNLINKTKNTCLTENHQCIPKTNITNVDYTSKIDEAIGTKSVWYKEQYQSGHDSAKNKMGKYYPVPDMKILGEPDQECVPANYTKIVEPNTKYVRPNTCPPNQSCRLPCKNCQNDDLECKTPEFKYTESEYNTKKESQREAGYAAAKGKYVNTYDGITNCVPSNYVPIKEGDKTRVKIGDTASACTGGAQCDNLSQEGWNTILESVRKEKDKNESECDKVGTSQKTCLKECENNESCNLNTYNVNNVKDMVTAS